MECSAPAGAGNGFPRQCEHWLGMTENGVHAFGRPCVGGDAHAAKQVPLGCIAPHTAQRCHSEPVTDVTGVGIRFPRPQARNPLPPSAGRPSARREASTLGVLRRSVAEVSQPKAVTEGLFFRAGGCGHPPLRKTAVLPLHPRKNKEQEGRRDAPPFRLSKKASGFFRQPEIMSLFLCRLAARK